MGFNRGVISGRLKDGWTIKEAILTPMYKGGIAVSKWRKVYNGQR